MAQSPESIFVYKILDEPPAEPLPETLPATALDAKDGFIHLSSARQIPITAGLFFANADKIWVLKLWRDKLDGRISHDTPYGRDTPHLHGSQRGLGKNNIESVLKISKGQGDEWKDAKEMAMLED
jgi:uncharacterized protein (DUF952 family)